ncbi:unnamed protein product [Ostreobium quekettii]|uniref:Uncharacterized protein n=1 Tax=Ostreobium quekettii TaxID=121088 RepID=A0A8S1JIW5_9CHLO|nr:unnamed protein product [Ostreobium quekettii]
MRPISSHVSPWKLRTACIMPPTPPGKALKRVIMMDTLLARLMSIIVGRPSGPPATGAGLDLEEDAPAQAGFLKRDSNILAIWGTRAGAAGRLHHTVPVRRLSLLQWNVRSLRTSASCGTSLVGRQRVPCGRVCGTGEPRSGRVQGADSGAQMSAMAHKRRGHESTRGASCMQPSVPKLGACHALWGWVCFFNIMWSLAVHGAAHGRNASARRVNAQW